MTSRCSAFQGLSYSMKCLPIQIMHTVKLGPDVLKAASPEHSSRNCHHAELQTWGNSLKGDIWRCWHPKWRGACKSATFGTLIIRHTNYIRKTKYLTLKSQSLYVCIYCSNLRMQPYSVGGCCVKAHLCVKSYASFLTFDHQLRWLG